MAALEEALTVRVDEAGVGMPCLVLPLLETTGDVPAEEDAAALVDALADAVELAEDSVAAAEEAAELALSVDDAAAADELAALVDAAAESVLATLAEDADAAAAVEAALSALLLELMDVIVHVFSSFTRGVPLASVIGVIVIVHVSSIGPAELGPK